MINLRKLSITLSLGLFTALHSGCVQTRIVHSLSGQSLDEYSAPAAEPLGVSVVIEGFAKLEHQHLGTQGLLFEGALKRSAAAKDLSKELAEELVNQGIWVKEQPHAAPGKTYYLKGYLDRQQIDPPGPGNQLSFVLQFFTLFLVPASYEIKGHCQAVYALYDDQRRLVSLRRLPFEAIRSSNYYFNFENQSELQPNYLKILARSIAEDLGQQESAQRVNL